MGLVNDDGETFETFAKRNKELFNGYPDHEFSDSSVAPVLDELDDDDEDALDINLDNKKLMWSCHCSGWSDKLRRILRRANFPEAYVKRVKHHRLRATAFTDLVCMQRDFFHCSQDNNHRFGWAYGSTSGQSYYLTADFSTRCHQNIETLATRNELSLGADVDRSNFRTRHPELELTEDFYPSACPSPSKENSHLFNKLLKLNQDLRGVPKHRRSTDARMTLKEYYFSSQDPNRHQERLATYRSSANDYLVCRDQLISDLAFCRREETQTFIETTLPDAQRSKASQPMRIGNSTPFNWKKRHDEFLFSLYDPENEHVSALLRAKNFIECVHKLFCEKFSCSAIEVSSKSVGMRMHTTLNLSKDGFFSVHGVASSAASDSCEILGRVPFTEEEDKAIIEGQQTYGNKWETILSNYKESFHPKRTGQAIKDRHVTLRKRQQQKSAVSDSPSKKIRKESLENRVDSALSKMSEEEVYQLAKKHLILREKKRS